MVETLSIKAERGREFPRDLTRGVGDFGDWAQLEPLFVRLEAELREVKTPADLMRWLGHESEVNSAIQEEATRRYIANTCQTDDAACEQAYMDFLEKIEPQLKPWHDKLAKLYLACPPRLAADRARLDVLDRGLENHVKLYREENVALELEDQKLAQQYQKISAAMTVTWRGTEKTLQQMAPLQEEPDRALREEAWRTVAARRLADRAALDDLMDKMIELRTRQAKNAGFDNFRDYQHQSLNRFDYTPQDCMTFHRAVEHVAAPRLKALRERQRTALKVDALRPWDLQVDPQGRPPLRPFAQAEELEARCAAIFDSLDPALGKEFATMREQGLLDLASRKGKAPGGYQSTLEEVRLPFIFMNAAGTNRDVFTLLHEGGHAFHAFATRLEPIQAYRHATHEFSEVASMSMEMMALGRLGEFYPDAGDLKRAQRKHVESIVEIIPWIATIDAIQHWMYTHPGHGAAEREEAWLELERRFSPVVDWTGLGAEHRSMWQRQLHLYQVPFYYIEYGIAQLGALQLWLQYREDPTRALANYKKALALGGSRPLPALFAAADLKFDFTERTLAPIMDAVGAALAEMD